MSKTEAKTPRFSESISSFCKMVDEVRSDYVWNYDEVNRLDKLTQDYLHQLELGDLDYSGRAKVATRLAQCRQLRRKSRYSRGARTTNRIS